MEEKTNRDSASEDGHAPCLHLRIRSRSLSLFRSCLLSCFSLFIFRCFLSPLSIFLLSPPPSFPPGVGGRARFASRASSARDYPAHGVGVAPSPLPPLLPTGRLPPPLPPHFRSAFPSVFFFRLPFLLFFHCHFFFFFSFTSSFLNSPAHDKVIQCCSVNNMWCLWCL